jgi:hypothetical protein
VTTERALIDLFHEALDAEDVAGPFQRLQLELENPTGAANVRRARRTFMTRNRLALLAAALVVLVVASVLVGTRIYSSQFHNTSGIPAGSHPQINQTAVTQLLSRPLHFQALKPTDPCPDSSNSYGFFGVGPVYGDAKGIAGNSSWGTYWNVAVLTPPGLPGPVIVRSRDLSHGTPVLDIGPLGAGPVYATDVYHGNLENQFQAVALDTVHGTKSDYALAGIKYTQWSWLQGFKKGWGGGCVGAQIDGPGLTEIFYAEVPNS